MALPEKTFDAAADRTLAALLRGLDELDGVEAELSMGVLRISFEAGGPEFVVNSHRAAGQIWLAADREAFHFDPTDAGQWIASKAPHGELFAVLSGKLGARLGRPVSLG